METCPKCSCRKINGPRYRKHLWGYEVLQFTCARCGYVKEQPTHDSASDGAGDYAAQRAAQAK
jgi:hypothetical protein